MKSKILIILSSVAVLHLVLGGLFLTGGCSTADEEPMPEGVYTQPGADDSAASSVASKTDTKASADFEYVPPTKEDFNYKPVADDLKHTVKTDAPAHKAPAGDAIKYKVVKGDSLSKIAKNHGISVHELASYNNITDPSKIKIGQTINIPPGGKAAKADAKADAKAADAKKDAKPALKTGAAASKPVAKTDAKAAAPAADGSYVIQKGDSPATIAAKFHVKVADLMAANNIKDPKSLQVGQKLVIPKAGTATAAPAKASNGTTAPAAAGDSVKSLETAPAPATTKSVDTNDLGLDDIVPPTLDGAAPATTAPAADAMGKAPAAPSAAAPSTWSDAEAKEGDTIETIALRYGVKADAIKTLNPGLSDGAVIKKGTIVKLPSF